MVDVKHDPDADRVTDAISSRSSGSVHQAGSVRTADTRRTEDFLRTSNRWDMQRIDFKTAFLQGEHLQLTLTSLSITS